MASQARHLDVEDDELFELRRDCVMAALEYHALTTPDDQLPPNENAILMFADRLVGYIIDGQH